MHVIYQYKLSYVIFNSIEVYEDPVSRTKKISYRVVEFQEKRIFCTVTQE